MSEFIPALDSRELPETGNKAVEIRGRSILICRSGDTFHAIANRCSHRHQPLEGGHVRGHFIACPVHGVRFDLRTGMPLGSLTREAVETFPVRLVDGWIEVGDPAPAA